jgi:predicted hydrocarbon binding protein
MPFHVDRFCLSFKEVVGKNPSSLLGIKFSEYEKLKAPAAKANFIKRIMDRMLAKNSKSVAKKVMLECGYMMRDGVSRCINENRIRKTKELFARSEDLKDFVYKYSKHSGGKLEFKDNVIKATYNRCYCGSVSGTKEKIPLTYCYCGAGWYKRLFEEVLSRPVKVEVLRSIASGADKCELAIYI